MTRRYLIKIRVRILAEPVHLVILYCDESPPEGGKAAGDTAPPPLAKAGREGHALLRLVSSAASASSAITILLLGEGFSQCVPPLPACCSWCTSAHGRILILFLLILI